MAEEKICPLMSGGMNYPAGVDMHYVYCEKEGCKLWVKSETKEVPFPEGETTTTDTSHCGLIRKGA